MKNIIEITGMILIISLILSTTAQVDLHASFSSMTITQGGTYENEVYDFTNELNISTSTDVVFKSSTFTGYGNLVIDHSAPVTIYNSSINLAGTNQGEGELRVFQTTSVIFNHSEIDVSKFDVEDSTVYFYNSIIYSMPDEMTGTNNVVIVNSTIHDGGSLSNLASFTLNDSHSLTNTPLIIRDSSNIQVFNNTISSGSNSEGHILSITNADNIIISNNIVDLEYASSGINSAIFYLESSTDTLISNNSFVYTAGRNYNIFIRNSLVDANITISHNSFDWAIDNIYVVGQYFGYSFYEYEYGSGVTIAHNDFSDTVNIHYQNGTEIFSNIITEARLEIDTSYDVNVSGNWFYDWAPALDIRTSHNVTVSKNWFDGGRLYTQGTSSHLTLESNQFHYFDTIVLFNEPLDHFDIRNNTFSKLPTSSILRSSGDTVWNIIGNNGTFANNTVEIPTGIDFQPPVDISGNYNLIANNTFINPSIDPVVMVVSGQNQVISNNFTSIVDEQPYQTDGNSNFEDNFINPYKSLPPVVLTDNSPYYQNASLIPQYYNLTIYDPSPDTALIYYESELIAELDLQVETGFYLLPDDYEVGINYLTAIVNDTLGYTDTITLSFYIIEDTISPTIAEGDRSFNFEFASDVPELSWTISDTSYGIYGITFNSTDEIDETGVWEGNSTISYMPPITGKGYYFIVLVVFDVSGNENGVYVEITILKDIETNTDDPYTSNTTPTTTTSSSSSSTTVDLSATETTSNETPSITNTDGVTLNPVIYILIGTLISIPVLRSKN